MIGLNLLVEDWDPYLMVFPAVLCLVTAAVYRFDRVIAAVSFGICIVLHYGSYGYLEVTAAEIFSDQIVSSTSSMSGDVAIFGVSLPLRLVFEFLFAVVVTGGIVTVLLYADVGNRKRVRGSQLRRSGRRIFRNSKKRLMIGDRVVPKEFETRSISIEGVPGSGKTEIIVGAMEYMRHQDYPGMCLDLGGEMSSSFFADNDVLIDCRNGGISWSPLAEIGHEAYTEEQVSINARRVAVALIPEGLGPESEWRRHAASVFAVVLEKQYEKNGTNEELIHYLDVLDLKSLSKELKGLGIDRLFEQGAERMLASILGVLSLATQALRLLDPKAGKSGWSLSRHVGYGIPEWIFVVYDQKSSDMSVPLRQALINLAIQAVLSSSRSKNNRFCLILDELPSHGYIADLEKSVALGRKVGMVAVLGYQSRAQLRSVYGENGAAAILGCAGTKVFLRCTDPTTAQLVSEEVGEEEYVISGFSAADGVDYSKSKPETRRLLLPSEIQELPDLVAIVHVAGTRGWFRVKITIHRKRTSSEYLRAVHDAAKPKPVSGSCDFDEV